MKIEAKPKTVKWISATKEDLQVASIKQEDNTDVQKTFEHHLFDWKVGQREKRKKTGPGWSDERNLTHLERMKQVCAQRREPIRRRF